MFCRNCKNIKTENVIDLGYQKITSVFKKYGDHDLNNSYPISLNLCNHCGLLQLCEITPQDDMYINNTYGYLSGISYTMKRHLNDYNKEICTLVDLKKDDTVLDIGSNDATFLHYYNSNLRRIGVDPTGEQFKDNYKDLELLSNYFIKNLFIEKFGNIKCKVISSICCFYDLPDPVSFAQDIYDILEDDGVWTTEQSYLLNMLDTNSLDTICHEHIEYYSLTPILEICKKINFKIIDIKFNESNGGSFRLYFAKKSCDKYIECTDLIKSILLNEEKYDLLNKNTYINFIKNCNSELNKLVDFIDYINIDSKSVYLYGASTKGNTILQYCNITEEKVKYAVERNPAKIGLSTNTGIEIISEETMRKNPPEYLIVLPWHFKKEIIEREKEYLNNGGQLIFYFPTFEIVSNKPKLLLTGCDGFIGSYIKENYNDYTLYGITRTKKETEKNIMKTYFDMNDYDKLNKVIKIINPENIIHLAGISSSIECFNNPLKSLQVNGMITANLCDIIYKNNKNIKLFNASSSEIYKDHTVFNVDEYSNINNVFHSHPYSIGKIIGHQIVKFYRDTYNLHFSNGIIFTTQSVRKSNNFLLNKIFGHLKTKSSNPLTVGSLDSYRNIIHPLDVIFSIKFILNNNKGDDYNICNYNSYKIDELVFELYKKFNIELVRGENSNTYYDKKTNMAKLIIENKKCGIDTKQINITAYPSKLRMLDWKIKYSIKDIMNEFI